MRYVVQCEFFPQMDRLNCSLSIRGKNSMASEVHVQVLSESELVKMSMSTILSDGTTAIRVAVPV